MKSLKIALCSMLLLFGITNNYGVNAEQNSIDLRGDIITRETRDWTTTTDFHAVKTNVGLMYNVEDAMHLNTLVQEMDLNLYYNLSNVLDEQLKEEFIEVVNVINMKTSNKLNFYTENAPDDSHQIKVSDYMSNPMCSQSYIACSNIDEINFLEDMIYYDTNNRKVIIFHEILQSIGIGHFEQDYQGTVMNYMPEIVTEFNIDYYYNDVSLLETLDNPFTRSVEVHNDVKYEFVRFLNLYLDEKHKFDPTEMFVVESVYYKDGKQREKVLYDGTENEIVVSRHTYEETGRFWKESNYYSNGKLVQYIIYEGTARNHFVERHFYNEDSSNLTMSIFYNEGKKIQKVMYDGLENPTIVSTHLYEETRNHWERSTYFNDGITTKDVYYTATENNSIVKIIFYKECGKLIDMIEYR